MSGTRVTTVLLALLIVALAAPAVSPNAAASPAPQHRVYLPAVIRSVSVVTPRSDLAADRQYSLGLHNNARAAQGQGALQLDEGLNRVAQAHVDDMARRNYFSHTTPEGLSPWDRLRQAGVTFGAAGENLAKDYVADGPSQPALLSAFTRMLAQTPPNDGHRANILNPTFRRLGVGVARDAAGWLYSGYLFAD
ncbi:MAG: CAP domain-containing protein [Chloroflexota bacterium]